MKIAFCAPFYGQKATGGAEAECRKTVLHLAQSGVEVEVFTTSLIDLQHDWNINAYKSGAAREQNIKVHRFPAEKCVSSVFSELNSRLIAGETLSAEEEKTFLALNINSCALLEALDEQKARFDWICFIPYLFGTTFHGIRVCGAKSILIPCLHDEGYARISLFNDMFQTVSRIVFHTESEMTLAHRLYDYDHGKDRLIGEGITTDFEFNAARFRKKYDIKEPFILYAGRKNESKNTPLLVDFFKKYKKTAKNGLKLVLIGPGTVKLPPNTPEIIDLGYISEQDKRDSFSAASIFCQPSLNESFSIVLMEAWNCRTPALVHGDCAVTKEHAIKSNGALWFTNFGEFASTVDWFLANPEHAKAMGAAGQSYVLSNFKWPTIVERFKNSVFTREHELIS